MSRFDKHFKMNEQDAIEYAREKLAMFPPSADLKCKEIGDGNINYVFRVWDETSGKSVIIKHADVATRSTGRALDTDRNRIEAEILQIEGRLSPGMVPAVYLYDPVMCCLCMEDLSDHAIMRYALIDKKTFPRFAEDISDFLVNTLLLTTDFVMEPSEKKELAKRFTNPALCDITERLVYTDPYTNWSGRNKVFPPNQEFAERELYNDGRLKLEVAKLKDGFKNNSQALIHGDLHTGSIFVREDSTKVIDPEFAFYGPMGYDIGNVIANLFFAWANAYVSMDDDVARDGYLHWIEDTVESVIDLFRVKFADRFQAHVTDVMAKAEGFCDWYISGVLADTAGVAGLEMHRRTVGAAQVKDITSIADPEKRALAERIVILAGKHFILHRNEYEKGSDYVTTIRRIANQF